MQSLPQLNDRIALFLDFDGTLVDIAPRPEDVVVEAHLLSTLRALHERLDGALAIISGRAVASIDGFLAPLVLPIAGEHGAQMRGADGRLTGVEPPDLFLVNRAAQRLAVMHPLLLIEEKEAAIAVHYRQAPELESLCLETLTGAVSRSPGTELLRGKLVFEVKPQGVNKGRAIRSYMAKSPFEGRLPFFIGDDLTDEDGFGVVQALGGYAVKVGDGPTQARHHCPSPAELRRWLAQAAADLTAGAASGTLGVPG